MTDTTAPISAADWANALDAVTGKGSRINGETVFSPSDVISWAFANGTAGGVPIASGDEHEQRGLRDGELLSADGHWIARWADQDGYWTGEEVPAR